MQSVDDLRQFFDENSWRWPFLVTPAIREQGLLLGNGSVLARMGRNRRGEDLLALPQDEERLLALLSAVCGRQVSPRVMHYVSRASEQWRRGDKVMAQFELAFARFPRLQTSEDAFRLFLAETLLDQGMTPRRLTRELGFDPSLLKYDRDELRNPAGDGIISGRWVHIGGSAPDQDASSASAASALAIAARGAPLLETMSPAAVAWLAAFAEGATVAGAAALFFGLLFVPTPNHGGVYEGDVPGLPGVRYRLDEPEGRVEVTARTDGGETVTVVAARSRAGLYVDQRGHTLGRVVGGGTYLELDAVEAALREKLGGEQRDEPGAEAQLALRPDGPRLCPKPSPDRPGSQNKIFDIAYPEYVDQEIVNRGFPPLPPGLAFKLFDPLKGKDVNFDGCQYTTGRMQEDKGHYADMVQKRFFTDGTLKAQFLDQADRQIRANDALNAQTGRNNPIDWRFDERATADFAWDIFKKAGYLGNGRIKVHYTPYWEHTDELYPDPED